MTKPKVTYRWFINEDGGTYKYTPDKQAADFPDDYRMVFETEADAELAAGLISHLAEMLDLAAYSLDALTGMDANSAETSIEQAKAFLANLKPSGPNLVIPTEELVGKIAKVRLVGQTRMTVYVAEVRSDFGAPAWAGSWHGFTLDKGKPVELIEWLS